MATQFFGMRGNDDWVTDARPKNWRETILYLYPNGTAPLTAMLGAMKGEQVDDPEYNWWTQHYQNQGGAVTGIYKSADLSTGTGLASITAGNTFYVQMAEAVADHFREGHQAWLINSSDLAENCNCKVMQVVKNGASSYIVIKALQASAGDPDTDFDRILVVGNINPEGGIMPASIATDPEKWYNYTQIFRNSLSLTRTAMKTRLRTGDQYQKAKREALEQHSVEMEKAFLFGYPSESTGSNGKPERTTMGLVTAIRGIANATFGGYPATYTDYNGVVSHFPTAYASSTWLDKGEEWMDAMFEQIFRYGSGERLAYCGNLVLLAINKLVKNIGNFEFTPKTMSYGIQVMQWVTPYGTVNFKTHPLFNLETSLQRAAVIFEPQNLAYKYIDDTEFYADEEKQNTGANRKDGKDEEYLTEAGLEFHSIISCGFLSGFGTDD